MKLGDELPKDQQRVLKDLVRSYPDVFTDMPGETNVIQHQIKLTDDTPIKWKPYPLPYAMRGIEEQSGCYAGDGDGETVDIAVRNVMVKKKDGSNRVVKVKELFGRLRKARITIRPTKCLLGASRMEFLGHQVGGDVITLSRDNLEKVRNTPRPTN